MQKERQKKDKEEGEAEEAFSRITHERQSKAQERKILLRPNALNSFVNKLTPRQLLWMRVRK